MHHWKENLSEIDILFKYLDNIFRFLDFMGDFREMADPPPSLIL